MAYIIMALVNIVIKGAFIFSCSYNVRIIHQILKSKLKMIIQGIFAIL